MKFNLVWSSLVLWTTAACSGSEVRVTSVPLPDNASERPSDQLRLIVNEAVHEHDPFPQVSEIAVYLTPSQLRSLTLVYCPEGWTVTWGQAIPAGPNAPPRGGQMTRPGILWKVKEAQTPPSPIRVGFSVDKMRFEEATREEILRQEKGFPPDFRRGDRREIVLSGHIGDTASRRLISLPAGYIQLE